MERSMKASWMASLLPRPFWAADRAMAAHNRQPRDDRTSKRKSVRALEHDPEKWKPVFRKDHARQKHEPEKIEPRFPKDYAHKATPFTEPHPASRITSPLLE